VSDQERSRAARQLAERALVRLVREYGEVPEFVLLGGLVPDLLCSGSTHRHIGTTDVDVQVDWVYHFNGVTGPRYYQDFSVTSCCSLYGSGRRL
jgi:hypothetical protein